MLQPLKVWLEAMDTAVVSAAVVYMLLKSCYSDNRMLFHRFLGSMAFQRYWLQRKHARVSARS